MNLNMKYRNIMNLKTTDLSITNLNITYLNIMNHKKHTLGL